MRFYTDSAFGTFINGTVVETATTTGTITTSQVTALTDSTGIAKAQLVGKKLGAATVWAEAAISLATATSTGLIRTPLDYQVKSATATVPINLLFSSAEPGRMVISTATSGTKTAVIQFRVVNELGVGVNGQAVQLSLDSQSIAAGVTFVNSADGSSSSGSQTIKTDFDGVAKITVRAGPLPTGVVVTATLVSNPTVKAGSVGLSVTSGRISQKSMSIFTPTPSVEAFDRDNVPAELTITAADRLGNPVPEGTVMNFITSHGLVGTFDKGTKTLVITTPGGTATTIVVPVVLDSKGSCTLDKSSTCKVQLLSSGQRPANGVVSLLAYADAQAQARGVFDGLRHPADGVPGSDAVKRPERGSADVAARRDSAAPDREIAGDPEAALREARTEALKRHARACDTILEAKREGLAPSVEQRRELGAARRAFEDVRPHGWQDAEAAYSKDNSLAHEAGSGRTGRAIRALQLETELRTDPNRRADRFVERWQKLDHASQHQYAAGDYSGYKAARKEMGNMAMSLERDAQMESLLRGRKRELGIDFDSGHSLGRDLAISHGLGRGRGIGL